MHSNGLSSHRTRGRRPNGLVTSAHTAWKDGLRGVQLYSRFIPMVENGPMETAGNATRIVGRNSFARAPGTQGRWIRLLVLSLQVAHTCRFDVTPMCVGERSCSL